MSKGESPDKAMLTLAPWKHLLRVPSTIECPSMRIVDSGLGEPIFTGSGQLRIHSRSEIDFVMHATPVDRGEAFKRLNLAEDNPHNIHYQLGLRAIQYDGTEWNAGWTPISPGEYLGNVWRLSGPIHSLTADISGSQVTPKRSIEVIYDARLKIPLPLNMSTSIQRAGKDVLRRVQGGSKTVDVVGTRIDFFADAEIDVTWAVAATSEDFLHPYAENWVSEPLCLLLGQLVFPRLVARNFGDRSVIWLRPSPTRQIATLAASILREDPIGADNFWKAYEQILTMVVRARDASGERNFEPHPLTRYYHEIIQATSGSAWIWCLTLASAIEGITGLLAPETERESSYAPHVIESLKEHIKAWLGDPGLRDRIVSSVDNAKSKGTIQVMKGLGVDSVIRRDHAQAWQAVRNYVAHGNLVSPWPDQELEQRMRLLAEMMHLLSMKYVVQHSS
jgi:hypothetical protein